MEYELKPLDQQVIVITGASSGIGMCTAAMAADKGCKLVLAARSENVLAELCAEIRAAGGEAVYCVADVGRREDVEQIARVAIERFGHIDTWINDAGVAIYGRVWEVADADNRRLFDTNFWGVVYGSLVALPYLRESGGALINVGSEVSDAVVPLQVMYSSSKHAVKGFTDGLRIELLADKVPVSVTLIQPTAEIDPSKVAQAILHAATTAERDVTVGAMAKLNTANFKVMPRLADWMAKYYVTKQSYDSPPIDPAGTLFKAGEGGRIHGRPPEARH